MNSGPCDYSSVICQKKNLPDLCIAASSNSWRQIQGYNAAPGVLVRDQELRSACKAGAGSPCGTQGPNRDSVHHVSRLGFGCTCAILCRNSKPGPGASLGILTSMRDSMRAPASSYGLWDSVRTLQARIRDPTRDPEPQQGLNAAPRISIGIRMYMRHSMPEFHAGAWNLPGTRNDRCIPVAIFNHRHEIF